jgi:hypothetical protein
MQVGIGKQTVVKRKKDESKFRHIDPLREYRLMQRAGIPVAEHLRSVTVGGRLHHVFREARDVKRAELLQRAPEFADMVHKAAEAQLLINDPDVTNFGVIANKLVIRDFSGTVSDRHSYNREGIVNHFVKFLKLSIAHHHGARFANSVAEEILDELSKKPAAQPYRPYFGRK